MNEETKETPLRRFIKAEWQGVDQGSRTSLIRLHQTMHGTLRLAVFGHFRFDRHDIEFIDEKYRGGYWFGADPEWIYTLAVKEGNKSAALSYEMWRERKPMFCEGARVCVDAAVYYFEAGKRIGLRVTSFAADGESVIGVANEWSEKDHRWKVTRRVRITRAQIAEYEKAWKARKAQLKAAETKSVAA